MVIVATCLFLFLSLGGSLLPFVFLSFCVCVCVCVHELVEMDECRCRAFYWLFIAGMLSDLLVLERPDAVVGCDAGRNRSINFQRALHLSAFRRVHTGTCPRGQHRLRVKMKLLYGVLRSISDFSSHCCHPLRAQRINLTFIRGRLML